jgi:hypothetical protein
MERLRVTLFLWTTIASVTGITIPSVAIEAQLTQEQIRAALTRGKEAAKLHRRPDALYARFGGENDKEASGFLVTKLGSLSVMAAHMALRGLEPTAADVAQVIESPTMLVSAVIFGDSPSFAVDSYMVLDQSGKTIKPVTVRFDGQAERSAVWPEHPRFKAKVVASFNYADFDPTARTIITVFAAIGGAASFTVDFARID